MKPTKKIFIAFVLQLLFFTSFSQGVKNQEIITKALKTKSIENQFDILISKSPSFQNFKNIKNVNLNKFIKNFKDSLVASNKKFSDAQLKIQNQKNEIEKLNKTITTTNSNLSKISEEKNSINFFGARMSKAAYNTILWSIIVGLLVATLFFLFKFKSSRSVTKHAKLTLTDMEKEFETHRKKSLEREQVLRRKLQDEINKQRGVK